jgi:hypothetical protein
MYCNLDGSVCSGHSERSRRQKCCNTVELPDTPLQNVMGDVELTRRTLVRTQHRPEAPLVDVGRVKEHTDLCSEYEILITVRSTCAGGQCAPYRHPADKPVLAIDLTRDEVNGSSPLSSILEIGLLKLKGRGRGEARLSTPLHRNLSK